MSNSPNHVDVNVAHRSGRRFARVLREAAARFLAALDLDGWELSISLVTDRRIRQLNRTWRGKDAATDVLSFPAGKPPRGAPRPRPLGDVVISLDTAKRQARALGRPLESELLLYLAHGLLHLLGYDHQRRADAKEMARLERKLLGDTGLIGRAGLP